MENIKMDECCSSKECEPDCHTCMPPSSDTVLDETMQMSECPVLQASELPTPDKLKMLGMESCYRICGFHINFYKCGDTLPANFMKEHQIEADWFVSVQWGRDYKQMIDLIKRSQQIDREICKQQLPQNSG